MDNLCHTLVGAALAETGLGRRARHATAALVIGANAPDLDVLAAFTEHGLGFRRGITHGIPALVVLPFVLTGVLLLWDRRRSGRGQGDAGPGQLLLVSALAVATHPALDWMNVYGMRWLMPFDRTWTYGDALFIIDPWLLVILGLGWIVGRRLRRRGDAGGERAGRRVARAAVGASVVYIALMVMLTARARSGAATSLGLERPGPRRLMVAPPFFASWRRDVVYDAGDTYRFGEVVFRSPRLRPVAGELPKRLELLDSFGRTVPLLDLLDWARFPFAEQTGRTVRVDDARYGGPGRPSFASVTLLAR
ncbi:MAG: metal-dependent hydrolase [Gemmatimonadales bacterium]